MDNYIWISKRVYEWNASSAGGSIVPVYLWQRAYKIWDHSRELIENSSKSIELADGIINLKKCLDQRLKLIQDLYNLKDIKLKTKTKGYLELLEKTGLIRPFIMRTLLEIRNKIEHEDANPPSIERCKEFLDVIWYFLKSTDSIVQTQRGDAEYTLYDENGNETHYELTVKIDVCDNYKTSISGWFPIEYIAHEEIDGCIKVAYTEIHGKEKHKKWHSEKLVTDKWINGEIIFTDDDSIIEVMRMLFSAY